MQVSQQVDNHIDAHPSDLNQEKNNWFTTADKKGSWQKFLKLDYTSGFSGTGAIFNLNTYILYYALSATTNAIFLDKYDCGIGKGETLAIDHKIKGFTVKAAGVTATAAVTAGKAVATAAHAGAASVKFLGGILQAVPAKVQAGVTWAINQFM